LVFLTIEVEHLNVFTSEHNKILLELITVDEVNVRLRTHIPSSAKGLKVNHRWALLETLGLRRPTVNLYATLFSEPENIWLLADTTLEVFD
jgi:hypothetical protein